MRDTVRLVLSAAVASACAATLLAPASALAAPDRQQGPGAPSLRRVTEGADGPSGQASVSADGRYVVFQSSADNLVPDDTNASADVFRHDLRTGRTTRVSLTADGAQIPYGGHTPVISATGRYVVFVSRGAVAGEERTGYVRRDLRTGRTDRVGGDEDLYPAGGVLTGASVSANGRYVSFTARQTGTGRPGHRTAVRDLADGGLTVLESAWAGEAHLSDDGRRLVYWESVPAPVKYPPDRVFLRDLRSGAERRLDVAVDGSTTTARSGHPAISGDGRTAAFASWATDLVPGEDPNGEGDDVFVTGLRTGKIRRLDTPAPPGFATDPSLSGDGRYVVFGFTPRGSVHGVTHLYRTDLRTGRTALVSRAPDGTPAAATTSSRPVDARGRTVAFTSEDGALAPGRAGQGGDVYVRTLN
ncbi:TolB family protein [Streptomyces sp. NPDC090994]|uniref:TolB family protein n=1 Tax=Streptomyces sp. NPDC090994 TaxID=3365969 RepID=UPI0038226FC0